jgi:hypothetical protein
MHFDRSAAVIRKTCLLCCLACSLCYAEDPALTLYNQRFAVVRETFPIVLKQGVNQIQFTGATAHLEPDSVMLRDPSGNRVLQILEQNYRADPVSVDALMVLYEGKTIEFQVRNGEHAETIQGKIIRAGSVSRAGSYAAQQAQSSQLILEIGGKLRFDLPGVPLFPSFSGDTILKPALNWTIQTDRAGSLDAELAYISGGFNWESDYNVVQGAANALDLTGWVTLENRSGKTFENARIKLMAGDVNKIQPAMQMYASSGGAVVGGVAGGIPGSQVTQKRFDEYHLYTLKRPVTLHDKESKQVEFVRANGVKSETLYVYDGLKLEPNRYMGVGAEQIRQDSGYGTQSNPKVWVMREFVNSDANHLGMPLPKGRVRFYLRDTDGRLEFTGEDTIDHTPKDERVRLFTGAAFDLVGERRRTSYRIDHGRSTLDESFEIKLRNRKAEPVEVRIVEHLYRWNTWEIQVSSVPFSKTESQTIEFRVPLQPGEEKTVTYVVHYTW